jgi:hypothetical protein
MKKHYGFRLSDEVIATLTKYAETHNCDKTQALEFFISLYPIILRDEERRQNEQISIDNETKEFPCNIRIKIGLDYYCANRPPKAVKLLSLDICKVCKIRQFGLPSKALNGISENSLITDDTRKKYPHYDPKKKDEPETKEWRSTEQ